MDMHLFHFPFSNLNDVDFINENYFNNYQNHPLPFEQYCNLIYQNPSLSVDNSTDDDINNNDPSCNYFDL